jgi:hypothetical protein
MCIHQVSIKVMMQKQFFEKLEQALDYAKTLFGDFSAKVGRENIFKPKIGNESLHQDRNGSGVRIVNFSTTKICRF